MINSEGGVNGRKITFISYDDAYSRQSDPSRRAARRKRRGAADFSAARNPSNSAIHEILNAKKVAATLRCVGGTKFGDPKKLPPGPWAFSQLPRARPQIYANTLSRFPEQQDPVFWQNDDAGKDQIQGIARWLATRSA